MCRYWLLCVGESRCCLRLKRFYFLCLISSVVLVCTACTVYVLFLKIMSSDMYCARGGGGAGGAVRLRKVVVSMSPTLKLDVNVGSTGGL